MNEPVDSRAFLEVEHSLSGKRWQERLSPVERQTALAMAQQSGIPEVLTRVLAARGVGIDEAERFMAPSIRELMPDPSTMTDMDPAAERIGQAVIHRERVAIFGDYDVDGAASSALLARFLTAYGVPCEIYIPDRITEGYGPNPDAIEELAKRGADLLVTVDCGATSHEALGRASELGLDAVVLDHHQMGIETPPAVAVVNPNRQDDLSGLGQLCACGVVFMTLVAVQRLLRDQGRPPAINLLDMLDLTALATVCDVVPLTGLNRAFVAQGLKILRVQKNSGLLALSRVARLDGPISPYHLGFLIGPRINAGGRIGDAALGSRLLTVEDAAAAGEIAEQLDRLNQERQAVEAEMLAEAMAEAEAESGAGEGPSVIVTARENWHPGIVGLLASRLKERFHRPAFAVAFDPSGRGTGSGRSIPGVDLGHAVREAVEEGLLEKGGGHAMAAGLTVKREKLGALRAFFDERLSEPVAAASDSKKLKIDAALTARGATLDLLGLLEQAGPYGAGHSPPVFAFPNHLVKYARVVGRDHVSVTVQSSDGAALNGIAFRAAEELLGKALLEGQGRRMHFAGALNINHWQGQRKPQLRIIDAAIAR